MILVLAGTHHQPFDRLVGASEALAARGEEVVVQAGASTRVPVGCTVAPFWPPDTLAALADRADAIVSHAGPGSLFLAWERGKRPVVVPRDPRRGEHVDDHQQRFAATLGDQAVACWDVGYLAEAVDLVRGVLERPRGPRNAADPAFVARFDFLVRDTIVSPSFTDPARPPARGLWARLLGARRR